MTLILLATDSFNIAIPLIAGAATLVFLVFLMAVVFWLTKRKDRRDGAAWAAAARQLGLHLSPPTNAMLSNFDRWRGVSVGDAGAFGTLAVQPLVGQYAGRTIDIRIGAKRRQRYYATRHSRVRVRQYFTLCQAAWDAPVGMDFRAVKRTLGGQLTEFLGITPTDPLGLGAFDEHYLVQANDSRRLAYLLGARSGDGRTAADVLVEAAVNGWNVAIADAGVTVRLEGKVLQTEQLSGALQLATDLAARLEQAGRSM